MKVTGKLVAINKDFNTFRDKMTLIIEEKLVPAEMQEYMGKPLSIKIEPLKNKRGLNANGYAWALLGELQDKLKIPKEDLYKEYIRRCGSYEVVPIKNEAVDRFVESWGGNGLGWICETTKSKLDGYTNVLAYYGSSSYNSSEMAVLLDAIVEDCIENGVPTKREEEIEDLLKKWG